MDILPGVASSDPPTPAADEVQQRMFTINFVDTNQKAIDEGTESDSRQNNLVASLAMVPKAQGGPGLFVSFGGGVERSWKLSDHWYLTGELQSAGAVSALIGRDFQFHGPDETGDFRCAFAFEGRVDSDGSKPFNLEIATNTAIKADLLRIEGVLTPKEAQFRFQMLGATATLSPDSFDNFIAKILPKDGLRVDFDAGVGFGVKRGRFFEGGIRSAGTGSTPKPTTPPAPGVQPPPLPPLPPETGPGFGLTIPIGKSLGPLTIHNLQLRFGAEDVDGKTTYLIQAASSISAKLGPVMARVDRAGLKFGVRIPDREAGEPKGNLGFADVDVGAVLPNGVSLAIDAKGVVSGGGFLFHDKVQQVYAGVMQLSVKETITVKAFGLIATKMPDGSKGYSLIVFITAEDFQPIPIGMACVLTGLGGMVAINRTFDEEAMRAGLRNKTLGTLLFPRDPIRNAPEIIRNLITTFPAEDGAYLFGLLMKITWFQPTLVHLDIAIMVEVGKRMRVIVLGMISALLPTRENDLVRLHMDALGLLNLGQLSVAIDAVLVDSRLAKKFVLTGEMALRASMAPGRRNFVMAVGGFNPRFAPPRELPDAQAHHDCARVRQQPATDVRSVLRDHVEHDSVRCAGATLCRGVRVQPRRRRRLRCADPPAAVPPDCGLQGVGPAQARLAQPLQAVGVWHAGRAAAAAHQWQGVVRDLLVRLHDPLRQDAHLGRETAVATGRGRVRGAAERVDGTECVEHADRTEPAAWRLAAQDRAGHDARARSARQPGRQAADRAAQHLARSRYVWWRADRWCEALQSGSEDRGRYAGREQRSGRICARAVLRDDRRREAREPVVRGHGCGCDLRQRRDRHRRCGQHLRAAGVRDDHHRRRGPATNEEEDRYVLVAHRFFEQVRFSAVGMAPIRSIGIARFRNLDLPPAVAMRTGQFVVASVADGIAAPTAKPATFAETQATLSRLNRGVAGEAIWQILPVHETVG